MAKKPLDPTAMVKKLLERSAVAGPEWHANAAASVEDAKAGAIAGANRYKVAVQAAISKGRYEKGVGGIDVAETRAAILATPESAVSDGLNRRLGKLQRRFAKLAPLTTAARDKILGMPSDTYEQRKARMVAMMDAMLAVGDQMRA